MKIKITDKIFDVDCEMKNTTISKSTGNELKEIYISFNLKGKTSHQKFLTILENARKKLGIIELNEDNEEVAYYEIGNNSISFQGKEEDEDTIYHVGINCQQYDIVDVKKIVMEGIEFEVLNYEEEIDKSTNAIIINAILKSSEEQREKLNKKIEDKKYFEIVREGIDKKPLLMRYGLTIYSKHEDYLKRKIVLVEKCYDDKEVPNYFDVKNNLQIKLAKEISFRNILVKKLLEKGIIDDEDIKTIEELVEKDYENHLREFYLVDDVDNYK